MSDPKKWTPHHARETARREWRARVKYLEARLRDARCSFGQDGHSDDCAACAMSEEWFDLHAPGGRSWRSSQRPDPRRHYSRRHRRACVSCREVWRVTVMCGMRRGVGDAGTERGWNPSGCAASMRRDPHGRRP